MLIRICIYRISTYKGGKVYWRKHKVILFCTFLVLTYKGRMLYWLKQNVILFCIYRILTYKGGKVYWREQKVLSVILFCIHRILPYVGGKRHGQMIKQKEEQLRQINTRYLNDTDFSEVEDLEDKLETFMSKFITALYYAPSISCNLVDAIFFFIGAFLGALNNLFIEISYFV